jgi:hypothetical protein
MLSDISASVLLASKQPLPFLANHFNFPAWANPASAGYYAASVPAT